MLARLALSSVVLALPLASSCATTSSAADTAAADAHAGHHDAGHHDVGHHEAGHHEAGHGQEQADARSTPPERAPDAVATIESRSGSQVTGMVKFFEDGGSVRVVADLAGLAPGTHGFHLHEVGDCSAPDASSAKAHWNPGGTAHGAPSTAQHHAGDLGNLEADAQGRAHLDATTTSFGVAREPSALGRAVIVHEKADDLTSQPAGNAGPRQGCGVVVKP